MGVAREELGDEGLRRRGVRGLLKESIRTLACSKYKGVRGTYSRQCSWSLSNLSSSASQCLTLPSRTLKFYHKSSASILFRTELCKAYQQLTDQLQIGVLHLDKAAHLPLLPAVLVGIDSIDIDHLVQQRSGNLIDALARQTHVEKVDRLEELSHISTFIHWISLE